MRVESCPTSRGRLIYSWIDNLLQNGKAIPPDTMSANLAVRILRAAAAEGGNRREILSAIGLDETRLRNPLSRISWQVAIRFFKVLQAHFNDPAVHLRLGEKAAMQNFSDFGYATRLETDLASVIKAHVQLQPLRQNMVRTTFDTDGRPPFFTWEYSPDLIRDYATFVEFSVVTFARLSRQVLNEPPLLRSVQFRHEPQFDIHRYKAVFGCPVDFGMPQTRMEIAGRQVFRPSPFANQKLFDAASRRYERPATWMITGKTHLAYSYFYLTSELDKSPPTLDRMAASFGMSERTLRRKLVEEGMSFRDLLDCVRKDMCQLYFMEDTRSLGEIALLLGYSDLSAFTRAYKNWTGTPPSRHGSNRHGPKAN
ncbi:AraC family transcriptional regulator ligand-binding domain-containing protein [Sphingorhabdus sp.]|uniref:AraC family transcriptional regulator n=1 Tax=Sphingorhabdus sp. TaxID=1902408 RepID=UPI003919B2B8